MDIIKNQASVEDKYNFIIDKADDAKKENDIILEFYILDHAHRFEKINNNSIRKRILDRLLDKSITLKIPSLRILEYFYPSKDLEYHIAVSRLFFKTDIKISLEYLENAEKYAKTKEDKFELAKVYFRFGFTRSDGCIAFSKISKGFRLQLQKKAEHELNNFTNQKSEFCLKATYLKAVIRMHEQKYQEASNILKELIKSNEKNVELINYTMLICQFMIYDNNDEKIFKYLNLCVEQTTNQTIKKRIKELQPIIQNRLKDSNFQRKNDTLSQQIIDEIIDDKYFENKLSLVIKNNNLTLENSNLIKKLLDTLK
ncbi:unnamed protein product [Brachionus calyciflorus]|uniref:Uncharacterized protein n=1 Tax=Brachionus calyciflorus TaxID=104777 RepID=A0A813YZR2_9BILA|nr:unnamed protein product [Brachionus calyciflorus]